MYRTKTQVAQEIIAEGRRQGVTPRGIVIGLATGLVESNLTVYANAKVSGSLNLPHDAVGSDGLSVGVHQQQVRQSNGQWWWGPVEVCQDPTGSSRLFFAALKKLDYGNTANSPGYYAQAVQKSEYPDRYDERMAEAQALYNQLSQNERTVVATASPLPEVDQTGVSPNTSSRYGAKVRLHVKHTQEGDGTARSLAGFLQNSASEVSYHYSCDNTECIAVVDTDRASWSVLDANPYTINFCYAGSRAAQSRSTWLNNFGKAIDMDAWLFVRDARQYGIDIRTLTWDEIGAGKSGATDHYGITKGLGVGTHTDVGPNYPWDVWAARVDYHASGETAAPIPVANAIDEKAAQSPWLGERKTVGENATPDGRGRWAEFASGYIYWTASTGAHPIPAALFGKYAELDWEAGTLGYPIGDHTVLNGPDGKPWGDVQGFEGGALYRRYGQPAFLLVGEIRNKWNRNGFENGPLGWPTSDETPLADGGRQQTFEHGRLVWSPDGVSILTD